MKNLVCAFIAGVVLSLIVGCRASAATETPVPEYTLQPTHTPTQTAAARLTDMPFRQFTPMENMCP